MNKVWIFPFALVLVVAISSPQADASRTSADSLQPRITRQNDQRMLVVTRIGDPSTASKEAFHTLFKTYYKSAGRMDMKAGNAPRARWKIPADTSNKQAWTGSYAIPISESFPDLKKPGIGTEIWEYGMVVEIMHLGPYATEGKDIADLTSFAARNGYMIVGDHEEEYQRGPGLFFKGNPEKYRTIIRYKVEKIELPVTPVVNASSPQASDKTENLSK